MNSLKMTRLSMALGLLLLIPAASAYAQDTVIIPAAPQTATTVESDSPPNALLISGLVSFGISYGASAIVASQSNHQGDDKLYIPIAGPWLDLADRGGCTSLVGSSRCDGETTNKVLLVIDGVVQGAGVLAVVGGILAPGGSRTTQTTVSQTGVHFAPVSYGAASPGLAAFGRF